VTDAAQIEAAAAAVESLDILVNNAGIALSDDLSDRAAVEQHLAVNLFGTYGVTGLSCRCVASGGGAIVSVGSASAFVGQEGFLPCTTTKAAVVRMTRCLAVDLAPAGIR
jgi:NAD(P)-dependent dehydrogenase (short-subunit alcohol dehydrogenase family)